MDFSEILAGLRTKEDVSQMESILDEIKRGIYETEWRGSIMAEKIKAQLGPNVAIGVEELEKALDQLAFVKVTVARKPSESTVEAIDDWMEANAGSGVRIEVMVNPEILGGVVLSREGRYADYSIRKLVEENV